MVILAWHSRFRGPRMSAKVDKFAINLYLSVRHGRTFHACQLIMSDMLVELADLVAEGRACEAVRCTHLYNFICATLIHM